MASVSIIGTNDFTKSPIRHALDIGDRVAVSSVPKEGKRTKETSFRINEVAINFLPATARLLRELSTQAGLYALVGERFFANYPSRGFQLTIY